MLASRPLPAAALRRLTEAVRLGGSYSKGEAKPWVDMEAAQIRGEGVGYHALNGWLVGGVVCLERCACWAPAPARLPTCCACRELVRPFSHSPAT